MRLKYAVICLLGRVIGIERPTGVCGAVLGGGSGCGRIRREEEGEMDVHAMAKSLRSGVGCGMRMGEKGRRWDLDRST